MREILESVDTNESYLELLPHFGEVFVIFLDDDGLADVHEFHNLLQVLEGDTFGVAVDDGLW